MADPAINTHTRLTSVRLVSRNVGLNIIGLGVPLLVAVFTIPILVRSLGTDRFGVLALAWMVIGYFNLFDLGLGRAVTQLVSEKLGAGKEQELPSLVWTALLLMLAMGVVGTLVSSLLSPWLVYDVLKIPQELRSETLKSFYLLALSLPLVVSTLGLRGILEAHQRFGMVNAVRIPMGIFTFLGPLMVLPFSQSLFLVVAVLVVGRLIAWFAHFLLCLYVMPALRQGISVQRQAVKPLLCLGGWMMVSNMVNPLLVYLDRFFIGALISVTAVSYYAIPYEVVTKLWIVCAAIVAVLFPAFSTSFTRDRDHTALLFSRAVKYTFLALFPLVLLMITFAYEGLYFWMGGEFSQNSSRVLQWLAVGVLLSSLTSIPFALVQGVGRPDLTAKVHLIELPFYLLGIWWLVRAFGIEGAAMAWTLRHVVDSLILFGIAQRLSPSGFPAIRRAAIIMGISSLLFAIAVIPTTVVTKGIFLVLTLLFFIFATWFYILVPEEQALLRKFLKGASATGESKA